MFYSTLHNIILFLCFACFILLYTNYNILYCAFLCFIQLYTTLYYRVLCSALFTCTQYYTFIHCFLCFSAVSQHYTLLALGTAQSILIEILTRKAWSVIPPLPTLYPGDWLHPGPWWSDCELLCLILGPKYIWLRQGWNRQKMYEMCMGRR